MIDAAKIEVCLSPALLDQYDIAGKIVVVIDIFRATSTMVAALHNGAKTVIPVASVAECILIGEATENSITAGERDGQIAPGLEYGNSPTEYPPNFIMDKTLVLTTTNGTKLLHMVTGAATIVIGSFLNLNAVCTYLIAQGKDVILACAAWKDKVNMEDTLFAGAVVHQCRSQLPAYCDSSRIAEAMYLQSLKHSTYIDYLKSSTHYQRLSVYGLAPDMEYCTRVDVHPIVPIYEAGKLVVAS